MPTGASSTTIVQTSSNNSVVRGGFSSFDTSLGALNSVTLSVTADDNREIFISSYPDNTPIDLAWQVNGALWVTINAIGGPLYPSGFAVPLSAAGSATNAQYGVSFRAIGSAAFSLDPAFFSLDYSPLSPIDI